jgi:hypothetical protein
LFDDPLLVAILFPAAQVFPIEEGDPAALSRTLSEYTEREDQKHRENNGADFHNRFSTSSWLSGFRTHREKNTITLPPAEASIKSRSTPKRAPGAATFVESLFLLRYSATALKGNERSQWEYRRLWVD